MPPAYRLTHTAVSLLGLLEAPVTQAAEGAHRVLAEAVAAAHRLVVRALVDIYGSSWTTFSGGTCFRTSTVVDGPGRVL